MPTPAPLSPKTHPTRRVPPIVWVGFTGICGGQRVTTKELDDFLYRRHPVTIATPSRCGTSTRWDYRQQSTSNSDNGQRNGNTTAMAMNIAMATQRQFDGRSSGAATAGSVETASAAQG